MPKLESVKTFAEWAKLMTNWRRTGINQQDLALVAGVSKQYVSGWIKQGKRPQPDKLEKICKWAGLRYDQMHVLVWGDKLSVVTMDSFSATSTIDVSPTFAESWERLTPDSKAQLETLAKVLPQKPDK